MPVIGLVAVILAACLACRPYVLLLSEKIPPVVCNGRRWLDPAVAHWEMDHQCIASKMRTFVAVPVAWGGRYLKMRSTCDGESFKLFDCPRPMDECTPAVRPPGAVETDTTSWALHVISAPASPLIVPLAGHL